MVKNVDKSKLKNWVVGDTFAWKIKSSKYPEYNNRYILFTMIETPKYWEISRTKRPFISKITAGCTLPQNQNEYEKAETIKLTFEDPVELAHRLYEVKYDAKPDEYDYVYGYVFEFWVTRYKLNSNMTYIGNFSFTQPKDSFIPDSPLYGIMLMSFNNSFDTEIDIMLKRYESNNLRRGIKYSKEYLENRENIRQDNIEFMSHLKEVSKRIREEQEKNPSIENNKRHRDTLTYVGPKKPDKQ